MNRISLFLIVVLYSTISTSLSFAQDSKEICVERVSVVEDGFVTVFDAAKSSAKVEATSSGLSIEYSDDSKPTSDGGIIEYGDNRAAVPGLDVVRGDEKQPGENPLEVVRGDDSSASGDPKGLDVFRGDGEADDGRPRPSIQDLGLLSLGGDKELAQLVSLTPASNGFHFTFDGLRLDVMGTPTPGSMAEAFAGLAKTGGGTGKIRIDRAETGCTPARLNEKRGLLELRSQAGHWLQLLFSKPQKVKDPNLSKGSSIYEFNSKLQLKLKRGKKN